MLYTTKYNTIWRTCQVELFLLLFIKHAIFDLGLQPMGTGPYKLVYIGKAHLWHYGPRDRNYAYFSSVHALRAGCVAWIA